MDRHRPTAVAAPWQRAKGVGEDEIQRHGSLESTMTFVPDIHRMGLSFGLIFLEKVLYWISLSGVKYGIPVSLLASLFCTLNQY